MYTLHVENENGEGLALTDNPNYTVYKIDGLNPPKATVNTSVNTTSDGSTVNSTRLENRNIVIYLKIEGNAEENRINLYKYFPVKKTVTLYYTNGSRDVFIKGVVESCEPAIFEQKQSVQISILCGQPYFSAMEELITVFGDVVPQFKFPFAIPKEGVPISTLIKNYRKSIINTGDEETGIIIELFATGTVVNPVIYDVNKKTHIALKFTMQQSDKIIINTNTGKKTITLIRDGEEINALGYMRPDSNFLVLYPGDNVFTYECESGGTNLQLTFTSSILYTGV